MDPKWVVILTHSQHHVVKGSDRSSRASCALSPYIQGEEGHGDALHLINTQYIMGRNGPPKGGQYGP